MVVDIAPQTELGTYTGLCYFFPTAAAVIGPNVVGFLNDALGGDFGVTCLIAVHTAALAFGACSACAAGSGQNRRLSQRLRSERTNDIG